MDIKIDGSIGGNPIAVAYGDKCSYQAVKGDEVVVCFYWRNGKNVMRNVTSKRILEAFSNFWAFH